NTVDVVVTSRDQWTLLVGTTFGGTNQNQMYGLDFGEKNLFGLGQTISYSFRQDSTGLSRSVGFSDPNIMGSRFATSIGYMDTPFETDRSYVFQHPFYSLETEDAYGASYNTRDHAESGMAFSTERFLGSFALGFDMGAQVYRPALTLSLGTQSVTVPFPRVVTLDNKLELSMALLDDPRNYSKDSYVQKFRQTEDIALGTTYNLLGGQSMPSLGSASIYTTESFQVTKWTKFFSRDYLYAGFLFTQNVLFGKRRKQTGLGRHVRFARLSRKRIQRAQSGSPQF
ncbi:MAG: hypothetical protein HY280_08525, partial [Nitrospinae bacterium]|nr:hypothetical protein [Nitrospinota bacterium]